MVLEATLLSDAETRNVGKRQCYWGIRQTRLSWRHTGDINRAHYRARFLRLNEFFFAHRRLLRCTEPLVVQYPLCRYRWEHSFEQ